MKSARNPSLNRRHFLSQVLATGALLPLPLSLRGQTKPPAHTREVEAFIKGIYAERHQRFTFRDDYPGGFAKWQQDARPELRRLVGLETIARQAGSHQPSVELKESRVRGNHTLQAGIIETEPNVRAPFWLLKPPGNGPFPLAILPHGHDRNGHDSYAGIYRNEDSRRKALAAERDVAVQAVNQGFVAIAPATRGLNARAAGVPDVFGRHGNRDCRSHFIHAALAGRTAIGERVWDMLRIIDWASALPFTDSSRLLMMGNSGGGVVTMYAAACDERIQIAVPSCSFSVISSKQGRVFHCDCCAVPGILQWGELYDVVGLSAPRFCLAVSGHKDTLHTEVDIERSAERVHKIFKAAGVPDQFEHKWGSKGHQFYSNLMWPFVRRAMKG